MKGMVRNGCPVGIVLLSCLGGTQGLSAAETAPALVLDEVKVSARHREESAQQEPIALSVLAGGRLNDAGIYRTEDMQQRVPSLLVSVPNARYTSYGIRGLGSSSFNDGIDGSVGVFLDGV